MSGSSAVIRVYRPHSVLTARSESKFKYKARNTTFERYSSLEQYFSRETSLAFDRKRRNFDERADYSEQIFTGKRIIRFVAERFPTREKEENSTKKVSPKAAFSKNGIVSRTSV